MRKSLLLLLLLSLFQVAAAQPFRILPPAGERGVTGERLTTPAVTIGSRVLRLTPGAVIYDQNNRTLTQDLLPVGADVFYTRDVQTGDVQRIYILTDQERARLTAQPPPKVAPPGAPGMQR